jgi:hypothetical protein
VAEEQKYTVLARHPGFEVREYAAHVVAEVVVEGSRESAGNRAFRSLVSYIGGSNHTGRTMAMTAPVVQQNAEGRRMAMTSPVVQRDGNAPGTFIVGFVMPSEETLATLPEPNDPSVTLRGVPAEVAAAVRYSGRWTQEGYEERVAALHEAIEVAGLHAAGEPRWARFDPPWIPWFLRRNEIVIALASS